jgi:ABC-type branched-subunit amino acid transport system substrate-binding protein
MTPTTNALRMLRRSYPFVMGLAVGALVAGLVVPFAVGDGGAETSAVAGGTTTAPGTAGGSGAGGGSFDGSGVEGDVAGDPAAADAAGGAAGGAAASGGPGGGAGTGGGGGDGGGGAPAPGGATGAAGSPGGATDRGVTADEIKLGVLLLDVGNLSQVGVAVPGADPEEQRAFYQALADGMNEKGGIHGSKVSMVFAKYDVFSQDSMRAACLSLTQDAKAFAVLDAGGFMPAHVLCVTDENDTPMVMTGSTGMPLGWYQKARNQLFTTFLAGQRQMAVWADEMDRLGKLKGKKLGIVHDGRPGQAETIGVLKQELERAGHEVVHVSSFAADFGAAASQVPVEVQQMRTKGAEYVFLTANTLVSTQFVQAADNQGYRPEYTTSDWQNMSNDTGVQNMPPSFDGSLAITTVRTGEWRVGAPEAPNDAPCREEYEARIGQELRPRDQESSNRYGLMTKVCAITWIFEKGAQATGPNLTRRSFADATARLGQFTVPDLTLSSFAPDKFDAADAVRTLRWKGDCRCWHPADDFRRTRR